MNAMEIPEEFAGSEILAPESRCEREQFWVVSTTPTMSLGSELSSPTRGCGNRM
mgnify:CR=1 FL=1